MKTNEARPFFGRSTSVVALTALLTGLACPPVKRTRTCKPLGPDQTRNRILSAAPSDSLVVFLSHKRIWVMGSAVARLVNGTAEPREVAEGVHEPLLKALYQETRHKRGSVNRVMVYATESVPRKTVDLVVDTARGSKLGRVLLLPWQLIGAGSCRTRSAAALKPEQKRPEPKLSAAYPLVIRADSRAVWVNGRLVFRLKQGRLIARPGSAKPSTSGPQALLKNRLTALLERLPVERWRLLVVVTPKVSNALVHVILSAAGQAKITKFKLERELER